MKRSRQDAIDCEWERIIEVNAPLTDKELSQDSIPSLLWRMCKRATGLDMLGTTMFWVVFSALCAALMVLMACWTPGGRP